MKRALVATILLCVLLSCVDIAWTWERTDEISEGPSTYFTTIAIRHGAFEIVSGDRRYSSYDSGLTTSFHWPQLSDPFYAGGWWGIAGVRVSVLIAVPVLAAAILGIRAAYRGLMHRKISP